MGLGQYLADYSRLTWHFGHFSPGQIQAYQTREILKLLELARKASPFYRDLYKDFEVNSLADFSRLPTISKAVMMANFNRLNTAGLQLDDVMHFAVDKELRKDYLGYYQDRYVIGLSSGTSGNKGIYVTDSDITKRLPGVFLARGGVNPSDLPLRIMFVLRVFSQGFADIRAPLVRLDYLPSMVQPADMIDKINSMSANILMAPPSVLRQLLPHANKIRKPLRRIVTYAEVLEPETKARLAEVFKTQIVEIYQASEGQIASPCRCGSLHINEDLAYVELLDAEGQPITRAGQGRAARMIVTNLVNRVQPLIRYDMNDIIELGEPCPCGSHFRVISRIIGRNDDVMHLPAAGGGTRALYPDLVSRWIITTDDRIREFVVEQDQADHLLITLDIANESARGEIEARLKARFAGELADYGLDARIDVEHRPITLPADNRKLKRFVRLSL